MKGATVDRTSDSTISLITGSTTIKATNSTTAQAQVRESNNHRDEFTAAVIGGSALVITGLLIKYIIST